MPIRVGLRDIAIWNETLEPAVVAYEQEQNEKGQIVFYGPSYFTRWSAKYGEKPMREVLLSASGKPCVINRGFGSSCPEHQLYYYPRMIRPLEPKVLVYESYGNSDAFGYSPEENWELALRVITYARTDFPGIHVYLCGPHPCRVVTEERTEKKNRYAALLKQYAAETPDCHYIDVLNYPPFVGKDVFIADGVHLSPEGYLLYADMFREALKDELAKY